MPKLTYKLITIDLSDRYLIRWYEPSNTGISNDSLPENAICSPKENIVDLSMSLLGVFIEKDYKFAINKNGASKGFLKYWDENHKEIKVPQIKEHFEIRDNFACWSVSIGSLKNLKVEFITGAGKTEKSHEVKCVVKHTPIVSNYWHFSIQWLLNGQEVISLQEKGEITKGWIRQMSHASRVTFKIYAKTNCPTPTSIPQYFYKKT